MAGLGSEPVPESFSVFRGSVFRRWLRGCMRRCWGKRLKQHGAGLLAGEHWLVGRQIRRGQADQHPALAGAGSRQRLMAISTLWEFMTEPGLRAQYSG